ncbi:thiol-disulfide oxidoreductase DCC family protein [Kurthia sibirica]|uniref:DUF393 domain-containing protein n=1 Tax=Kurthia sibirica TaxID=202750 RepID=A0A2U3AGD5_9BACL|nr:DCC1-like thiol-disulfide oxidoreductase family protein [Kurthia sibirica]PWI23564.1 hypothetical protein DEX24_15950 [Kurthia sibirica]GEK35259.1 hypothetical protein KSI01_27920 [Kurthia sibirica]
MDNPILFYDGDCGFCQRSVQLIIDNEKVPCFYFAPLQGDFAAQQLPTSLTTDLNSLVVLYKQQLYTQSDAMLLIVSFLSLPYSLAKIGKLMPRTIRNKAYTIVAQNRQKLSSYSKSCKLPTLEERARFIK